MMPCRSWKKPSVTSPPKAFRPFLPSPRNGSYSSGAEPDNYLPRTNLPPYKNLIHAFPR